MRKREGVLKILVCSFALILTLGYIGYRCAFTLPLGLGAINIVFGVFILLVEILEAVDFTIFFFNSLCFKKESPKLPSVKAEWPAVDVLIATINEDPIFLEQTILACRGMDYPNFAVYVCDDGRRPEIKKLATKLKVKYITRKNNKYAKAGNYNNALENTKAPYIAIFDADMRPDPRFLKRTVPYFLKYGKVGFVQTPQSFDNPDLFQNRLSLDTPFEQDYFYHHIQMGRNTINSTILCGTNCVISREAIGKICGFATNSIAEDIATGMLMEAAGYQGIATDEILAHGEAIDDLNGFLKQRSRWGRGCIQTFKNYGFFWRKTLSIRQKFDYLLAIDYWLYGIKRFIFLVLPLLFAGMGIIIIDGDLRIFLGIFFAQYLVRRFAIDIVEGHARSATWNKIYEIILMPVMAKDILKEIFGFGDQKFIVTPKGEAKNQEQKIDKTLFSMHLFFLVLTMTGIGLAIFKASVVGIETYIVPLIWMIINVWYLIVAIIFDLRKTKKYDNFEPNQVMRYSLKSFMGIVRRK